MVGLPYNCAKPDLPGRPPELLRAATIAMSEFGGGPSKGAPDGEVPFTRHSVAARYA